MTVESVVQHMAVGDYADFCMNVCDTAAVCMTRPQPASHANDQCNDTGQ